MMPEVSSEKKPKSEKEDIGIISLKCQGQNKV